MVWTSERVPMPPSKVQEPHSIQASISSPFGPRAGGLARTECGLCPEA